MRSLIEEALTKGADEPDAAPDRASTDEELAKIAGSLKARIKVVGCGGGGSNTIHRLAESGLDDVELYAINTDAQHLLTIPVKNKVLIGRNLTGGLGAGSLPQVGEEAAKESETHIRRLLEGADLVFVTCGLGGGTGTGSAPVVAKIAREMGALTIAVTTLPFKVEGGMRMKNAEAGLARLRDTADTTIVVPNDRLLDIVPHLPLNKAFRVADEVLLRSIRGITDMITKPGLVNLDFADLRTVMRKGGVAMIGMGEATGTGRAEKAMQEAIASPLLDVDLSTATGALVNVIGGPKMTLREAEEVAENVYSQVQRESRIIWGAAVDPELGESVRVMVVVTGVKSKQILGRTSSNKEGTAAAPTQNGGSGGQAVDFVL